MLNIYVKPPIYNYADRILPDTIIPDDYLSNNIYIKGSKNEIIPATFILKSDVDVDDVVITHSTADINDLNMDEIRNNLTDFILSLQPIIDDTKNIFIDVI